MKQALDTTLEAAAHRVKRTARDIRDMASDVTQGTHSDDEGRAKATADALGVVSSTLETVAESARASGLAVRDRGRDAAKAVARGERVLRDSGYPGAAVGLTLLAKRNAGRIAVAGAGLAGFLIVRRLLAGRASIASDH